ncbi:unnamed protein product, partial [Nesidiocoris tenuis]
MINKIEWGNRKKFISGRIRTWHRLLPRRTPLSFGHTEPTRLPGVRFVDSRE